MNKNEIRISARSRVPDSQKIFFTKEAKVTLGEFNEFEKTTPPTATNTKALFAELRKKKQPRDK